MDVEMTLPLGAERAIADGALGDDERAETDPAEKGVSKGRTGDPPREDDMEDEGDSPDGDPPAGKNPGGKKHHRRGKNKGGKRHRSWKPYTKLTWEERQKLDEKETRRACKRREQRFASGHPLAPYNTTQFLMDQHPPSGGGTDAPPDAGERQNGENRNDQGSIDSYGSCSELSANGNESPSEEFFYNKDFSQAYESYQSERLHNMSKEELIQEILDVERKLEEAVSKNREMVKEQQQNNNEVQNGQKGDRSEDVHDLETSEAVKNVQELMAKLREENKHLMKENEELKKKVAS